MSRYGSPWLWEAIGRRARRRGALTALAGALLLTLTACPDVDLVAIPGGVEIKLELATPGEYGILTVLATGDWSGPTEDSPENVQDPGALTSLPPAIETQLVALAPTNQETENTIVVQDNLRNGLWAFQLAVTGTGFPEMNAECSVEIFRGQRTNVVFTEGSNECTSEAGSDVESP